MSREPIGKIRIDLSPIDTVIRVEWADGVAPRSRVTYRGKAAHVDPETSRVIGTDAYIDGRNHPYVYEYETPLPAGYRRLPDGAVVCVADVVVVHQPVGLVFTSVLLRGRGGAHSVCAEQAEVEEALWGDL